MSKTYRYLVPNKLTGDKAKKSKGEALTRLQRAKARDTNRLFKREVAFTTWLERTSKDD